MKENNEISGIRGGHKHSSKRWLALFLSLSLLFTGLWASRASAGTAYIQASELPVGALIRDSNGHLWQVQNTINDLVFLLSTTTNGSNHRETIVDTSNDPYYVLTYILIDHSGYMSSMLRRDVINYANSIAGDDIKEKAVNYYSQQYTARTEGMNTSTYGWVYWRVEGDKFFAPDAYDEVAYGAYQSPSAGAYSSRGEFWTRTLTGANRIVGHNYRAVEYVEGETILGHNGVRRPARSGNTTMSIEGSECPACAIRTTTHLVQDGSVYRFAPDMHTLTFNANGGEF